MSVRAIAGLAVFNLALVGVGGALLWGLGALRWWTDLVRTAGVAYLLGLAATMVLLTLELISGVPVDGWTQIVSLAALILVGVTMGVVRRRGPLGLRPPGWRAPRVSLFSAILAAGLVVYFEALFRAARLASILPEWDGWWFWVPKAELIYFFSELDPELLADLPEPSGSYPPGLPAVHALAFSAMGAADNTTLHLQYWFYAVGFAAAAAGLLASRVRQAIWVPLLLVTFLAPSLVARVTWTYADIPLGYLVAIAALLLILWLEEREGWQLVASMTLLAGATLTKREGILFAACLVLAAMVASIAERRAVWPRLLAGVAIAFTATLAWRIWFTARGLPSDAPTSGYVGVLDDLNRLWPSLDLVVSTVFDSELWLAVPFLALAAVALALLVREIRVAVFALSFLVAFVLAATWTNWSNDVLPISQDDALNPIVRLTGTSILVLSVLTPILLERAWERRGEIGLLPRTARSGLDLVSGGRLAAWAVVAAAAIAYPASMLVGYSGMTLPGGAPRFPAYSDCVSRPAGDDRVRLVVAYASSYPEANDVQRRARAAGMPATRVAQDGCGRLRVFVDDVATTASGALLETARRAGFEPGVESDPD